jgi:hypothetical protein
MRWAGSVACIGAMRTTYKSLVRKSEGKKPSRRRQKDNVEMGLKKIEFEDMDWIHLAQDRD